MASASKKRFLHKRGNEKLDPIARELFELELALPDRTVHARGKRLIGFDDRYDRIRRDMRLLSAPDEVRRWSKQFYGRELPLCEIVTDRYPLLIFAGDVGTGKTATAEAACDRLSRESGRDSMLFKLSTRVRGTGKVGQMSSLINQAFEIITKEAGKAKAAFLIIDEADSLSATRDAGQSHHEDKVGVNTIIQKVDDLRRLDGRVLVILCTNRGHVLDPAIVRRAARIERFERPNAAEREKLIRMDYEGLGLTENIVKELVDLTGPQKERTRLGFTYSDLRTRLLPRALGFAFPDRKLTAEDLLNAARSVEPSPAVEGS
jgi:AAA+ superfamily predicted ATPase